MSLRPRLSRPSFLVRAVFMPPATPMRYCIETPIQGSSDHASIDGVLCIRAAPRLNAPPGIITATGSFLSLAVWPFGRYTLIVKQSSLSQSGPSHSSSVKGTSCFPGHLVACLGYQLIICLISWLKPTLDPIRKPRVCRFQRLQGRHGGISTFRPVEGHTVFP